MAPRGPAEAHRAAGLVIVAGMWWISFSREQHAHIRSLRTALVFGYGHSVVFAAAGRCPPGSRWP